MHNSENIIAYSALISALVGVFRSLGYEHDLSSASVLGQAVQKLPPNMKEAWTLNTVMKDWSRPSLVEFNDWLKNKAEAHEKMKASAGKAKPEDSSSSFTRSKPGTKVFASSSSAQSSPTTAGQSKSPTSCVACNEKHPVWRCNVFREKTPTQRAKLIADNNLCFSCLAGIHTFRRCPNPRK